MLDNMEENHLERLTQENNKILPELFLEGLYIGLIIGSASAILFLIYFSL
jgi:hypothetical protein